jgi:hypothetical protein
VVIDLLSATNCPCADRADLLLYQMVKGKILILFICVATINYTQATNRRAARRIYETDVSPTCKKRFLKFRVSARVST